MKNKTLNCYLGASLAGIILAVLAQSCAIINFEHLSITTSPASENQVLAVADPIQVTFSIDPDHRAAEQMVQVTSTDSTVSGDFSWEGQTLCFTPVPALVGGKRYELKISGQVSVPDGRKFSLQQTTSFFVRSDTLPSCLSMFQPWDGEDVAVRASLVLTFNKAMKQWDFDQNFSLSPSADHNVVWSADEMTVTITPKIAWKPCTRYTWTVAKELRDRDGLTVTEAMSHCFMTQLDSSGPVIASVAVAAAVIGSGADTWLPLSTSLATMRNRDGLLFTFSEPIALATLNGAFRISPAVKGHFLVLDATHQVWQPDEDFVPETEYQISVGTSLTDSAGNALASAWNQRFCPDVSYLRLTKLSLCDGQSACRQDFVSFNNSQNIPQYDPALPDRTIRIVATFNQDLSVLDRSQFASLNLCTKYFPDLVTVFNPVLESVSFPDAKSVSLRYSGFSISEAGTAFTPAIKHYFRFLVPSGQSGLHLDLGTYPKEDTWLVFQTK